MTLSKSKRRKNAQAEKRREMPLREDGQAYACVTKMLGNGRLLATCSDNVERLCVIRGSMRKREWIRPGDTVLLALRDWQDDKADVIFRYQEAEVQRLRSLGEHLAAPAQEDEDEAGAAIEFETDDWMATI